MHHDLTNGNITRSLPWFVISDHGRKSAPAVLQYGGLCDCRQICRGRCTCSRWRLVFIDDRVHYDRHWRRGRSSVIISQYLGAKEYTKMQTAISTALLTFLATSVILAGFGLFANRAIFVFVKDAGKHFGRCCVVSEYLFYGASIFIYVQRTFVNLQCAGKIKYPAVFVDVFYSTEHCVGSCGGNCIPEGSRGSGSGNRVCPGNCLGAFLLDPAPQTERI